MSKSSVTKERGGRGRERDSEGLISSLADSDVEHIFTFLHVGEHQD